MSWHENKTLIARVLDHDHIMRNLIALVAIGHVLVDKTNGNDEEKQQDFNMFLDCIASDLHHRAHVVMDEVNKQKGFAALAILVMKAGEHVMREGKQHESKEALEKSLDQPIIETTQVKEVLAKFMKGS